MSRRISERDLRAEGGEAGFTLAEIVVALAVASILGVFITRFFSDSHRAYNLQERMVDRDQNAQYVLKRLADQIMEAGANLPDSGWPVIQQDVPKGGFTMSINPRGGTQTFFSDLGASRFIPVDDETAYNEATSILIVRADKAKPIEQVNVDVGYNSNGFVKGLKQGAGTDPDTLALTQSVGINNGDALYAFANQAYALSGTDFSVSGIALAEGIESVSLNFYDATGSVTSDWRAMHSAKVTVTARTSLPDPGSPGDGYRRVTVNSEVRLRNRP